MEWFANYAPIIGLIFFSIIYLGILIFVMLPSNKETFDKISKNSIKEE